MGKSMVLFIFGLFAIILHELSHIAVAKLVGLKVKRVGINWKGPYVARECGNDLQNLQVSLAGPVSNLLLATAFWTVAPTFAMANLVIGAFNILPIPSSDGRRALGLARRLVKDAVPIQVVPR